METIENKNYQLIGLCCMKEKQDDPVYSSLQKQWDESFRDNNSFWLDVCDMDANTIAQELHQKMDALGLPPAFNQQYHIVVFHDLRKTLDTNAVEQINKLVQNFDDFFVSHSVAMTTHYAYVGNFSVVDPKFEERKKQVGILQRSVDGNVRVILVSEQSPGYMNGECWEPVLTVTDILRRIGHNSPLNSIESEYRVGFFTYRRYDAKRRKDSEDVISQCTMRLERSNAVKSNLEKIEAEIKQKLDVLAADAVSKYKINGHMQPQHPDLILPTGPLNVFARRRALSKGGSYDRAKRETEGAVEATAEKLAKGIKDEFALSDACADKVFEEITNNCSLYALQDGTVRSTIAGIKHSEPEAVTRLDLSYSPDGCEDRIDKFLNSKLCMAIYEARQMYCAAILAACDRHSENNDYEKMIQDTIKKKAEAKDTLDRLPNLNVFCADIIGHGSNMLSLIKPPSNRGTNVGFCVCEGSESTMVSTIAETEKGLKGIGNRNDNFYNIPGDGAVAVPIRMIRLNLFDFVYGEELKHKENVC